MPYLGEGRKTLLSNFWELLGFRLHQETRWESISKIWMRGVSYSYNSGEGSTAGRGPLQGGVLCVRQQCLCVAVLSFLSSGTHRGIPFGWEWEPDPRKSQAGDREHGALPVNSTLTLPGTLELLCCLKKAHVPEPRFLSSQLTLLCLVQLVSHCLNSSSGCLSRLPVNYSLMPKTLGHSAVIDRIQFSVW